MSNSISDPPAQVSDMMSPEVSRDLGDSGFSGADSNLWVAANRLSAPEADLAKSFGASLAVTDSLLITGAPTSIITTDGGVATPSGDKFFLLYFMLCSILWIMVLRKSILSCNFSLSKSIDIVLRSPFILMYSCFVSLQELHIFSSTTLITRSTFLYQLFASLFISCRMYASRIIILSPRPFDHNFFKYAIDPLWRYILK